MPSIDVPKHAEANSHTPSVATDGDLHPGPDLVDYMKAYAREKPEVAALWCLGIGFILGWKLKPW
jgi:hypothetical protein